MNNSWPGAAGPNYALIGGGDQRRSWRLQGLRGALTGAPGPYQPVSVLSGPAAEPPPSLGAGQSHRPITVIWEEPTAVLKRCRGMTRTSDCGQPAAQVDIGGAFSPGGRRQLLLVDPALPGQLRRGGRGLGSVADRADCSVSSGWTSPCRTSGRASGVIVSAWRL